MGVGRHSHTMPGRLMERQHQKRDGRLTPTVGALRAPAQRFGRARWRPLDTAATVRASVDYRRSLSCERAMLCAPSRTIRTTWGRPASNRPFSEWQTKRGAVVTAGFFGRPSAVCPWPPRVACRSVTALSGDNVATTKAFRNTLGWFSARQLGQSNPSIT